MANMDRRRALALYLALSVPFGILVHLCSEFAGLGRDADDLAFSPLHGYLLIIGLAALATFICSAGIFDSQAERRRRIGLMAGALPYGGRGARFFGLSAAMQFGFFLVTQLGEGCPLCKGDFFTGLAAAAIASAIGAFALQVLRRQIVRVFSASRFLNRLDELFSAPRVPRYAAAPVVPAYATFAVTRGNRPPPRLPS
jgi:hypothetical protein